MLAEIFARGPIACGVAVTPEFEQYTGGIFNDTTKAMVRGWVGLVRWEKLVRRWEGLVRRWEGLGRRWEGLW